MPLQRKLRELQGRNNGSATPPDASSAGAPLAYPFRPIGTLQSAFSQRNGTPRQPLLVPLARARVKLRCWTETQLTRAGKPFTASRMPQISTLPLHQLTYQTDNTTE